MARTSAIISLVVIFVLAVLINNEVQASQCMSKCNKQCMQAKKQNGVSCGVQCFVQCMDSDNPNSKLNSDTKNKLASLKQKASTGAISQDDVEDELREIAQHMMLVSEASLHHHEHKAGEKPIKAPKKTLNEDDDDITDDDDKPDNKL